MAPQAITANPSAAAQACDRGPFITSCEHPLGGVSARRRRALRSRLAQDAVVAKQYLSERETYAKTAK
jgi:hypothetical protein